MATRASVPCAVSGSQLRWSGGKGGKAGATTSLQPVGIIARKHLQKYYSKQVKEEEWRKLKHQGNGSYNLRLCRQRRGLASDSRPKKRKYRGRKIWQALTENQWEPMTRKPVFFLARQSAQKTQSKYPRKSTRRRAAAGSGFGAQWVRQRRRKGSMLNETSESLQSTTTKTKRVWIEKATEKRRNFKGQGTGRRSKIQCKSMEKQVPRPKRTDRKKQRRRGQSKRTKETGKVPKRNARTVETVCRTRRAMVGMKTRWRPEKRWP